MHCTPASISPPTPCERLFTISYCLQTQSLIRLRPLYVKRLSDMNSREAKRDSSHGCTDGRAGGSSAHSSHHTGLTGQSRAGGREALAGSRWSGEVGVSGNSGGGRQRDGPPCCENNSLNDHASFFITVRTSRTSRNKTVINAARCAYEGEISSIYISLRFPLRSFSALFVVFPHLLVPHLSTRCPQTFLIIVNHLSDLGTSVCLGPYVEYFQPAAHSVVKWLIYPCSLVLTLTIWQYISPEIP